MNKQKHWALLVCTLLAAHPLSAQTAAVNDIPLEKTTTISIKSGDTSAKCEKMYEVIEGTGQIEGDPNVLVKEARASWKLACTQWKKEIKEMNQDNKVLVFDCGKVTCSQQGSEGQTCRSEGSYKIKTKVN